MKNSISIEVIKNICHELAVRTMRWDEPIPDFETRFPNILESCLITPFQKYGGKDLYIGLISKSAILFYLLIKNHPFQNGNKRIAVTTLLVFLYINKKWLKVHNTELYNFSVWIAESPPKLKNETVAAIEKFIKNSIINLE